jgi:prepilin signal peptidase PulO-like enzyme (type II secretory pathway)
MVTMAPIPPTSPLVLIPLLALGAITSFTDIREGKIRNKHVFPFILLGILRMLVLDTYGGRGLVNTGIALAAGFGLWHLNLWSAGDAKLFVALAALVPLNELTMQFNNIYGFPSFMVLVNTFVPMFALMLFRLLFLTPLAMKTMLLRRVLKPVQVVSVGLALFVFIWLGRVLLNALGLPQVFIVNLLIMFACIEVIDRVAPKSALPVYVALSVVRLAVDPGVWEPGFIIAFGTLLISFLLLRYFVIYMGHHFYSTPCKIDELKPGMMPSEGIVEKDGKYHKVELITINILSAMRLKKLKLAFEMRSKGLNEEEVERIKKLAEDDKLQFDEILVQQTTPFAPFIFLGALLTLFTGGDPVTYVKAVHPELVRSVLPAVLMPYIGL